MIELVQGLTLEARIALQRKGYLQSALHHDVDLPVSIMGVQGLISQSTHSTSGL